MTRPSQSETIGSATKAVQGYPTQIWLPSGQDPRNPKMFALVHDRRKAPADGMNAVYFIPGNLSDKLRGNPVRYDIESDEEKRTLHIPAALLWDFHGGPCEGRGARYKKISGGLMDIVYKKSGFGRRIILPKMSTGTNNEYAGAFDLPYDADSSNQLSLMDRTLF